MIILYHNVFPDSDIPEYWWAGQALRFTIFKRHILWLAQHCQIVSVTDYLEYDQEAGLLGRKPIAITFDDGLQLTYRCVSSFLVENNIPATFFVPTSHIEHGEILWFSYLDILCSEQLYKVVEVNQQTYRLHTSTLCKQARYELTVLAKTSGDPVGFCKRLAEAYPVPGDKVSKYEGMTYQQLSEVGKSNLLEVGGHTKTHPYLNQLPRDIQRQEISDSKIRLTELTGKPIRYFAYPGGEYNQNIVELVKAAGYEASFAIIPQKLGMNPRFEVGRVGIYSQSLLKLKMKTMGVADLARWMGLRVG
jgi:peptidoglycan/xylan/chitin deacetylase (PgdA/CDA1 family)